MVLPNLPAEVWHRITQFAPQTPSTLTQFNQHSEEVRQHPAHRELYHSTSLQKSKHRYLKHLHTARNTALFYHTTKRKLVSFPIGHVFSFHPLKPVPKISDIISRIVPMFGDTVGVIVGSCSHLKILNLYTGRVVISPLMAPMPFVLPIISNRHVMLAGNGRLSVQRVEEKVLAFFEWSTSLAVREPILLEDDTVFMYEEVPNFHQPCFVGTAIESPHSAEWKNLIIRTLNFHHLVFKVPFNHYVIYLLRSRDKQTYAILVSKISKTLPTHFLVYRLRERDSTVWFGELPRGMEEVEILDNGNIIVPSRHNNRVQTYKDMSKWPICIVLNETETIHGTFETVFINAHHSSSPPVWSSITPHEIFVVIVGRTRDKIELLRLPRNQQFNEVVLNSFVVDNVQHVTVIADHYLLATDSSNVLHLAHFDRFCKDRTDDCPLAGQLFSRLFPDIHPARMEDTADPESSTVKRRRIDGHGGNAVQWL